jgi:hypothetical protein
MNEMARSSRSSLRRRLAWAIAVAMAVALVGCGEGNPLASATLYPVKGKVTLPDGKPLTAGSVIFAGTKVSVTNSAPIGSDGTFSRAAKEGLPEGEYKVRIEAVNTGAAKKKATFPFSMKYLDEDASGLTATVKPEGPNDFDFKLTTK